MKVIRSIADLTPFEMDWILERARAHRSGSAELPTSSRLVVGLAFFQPSLRTRAGFAAAAARLGAIPIEVLEQRHTPVSMMESLDDTVRTLAGYSDVLVVRADTPMTVPPGTATPVLNGGDGGMNAEHPSQALIDFFALQKLPVELECMTIALCGDLRMRAARSLLRLLSVRRPKRLVLVTEHALAEDFMLPTQLDDIAEYRSLGDLDDVDALYLVGIPHGALDEIGRARLRVTKRHLDRLSRHARVLSPLPLIDEIERDALAHPRVRVFDQSDDGLFVRMALIEHMLGAGPIATPTRSRRFGSSASPPETSVRALDRSDPNYS